MFWRLLRSPLERPLLDLAHLALVTLPRLLSYQVEHVQLPRGSWQVFSRKDLQDTTIIGQKCKPFPKFQSIQIAIVEVLYYSNKINRA